MRAFLFALTISIIVHFLAFYEIKVDTPPPQNTDNKTVPKGSDVKFVKLTPPKEKPKPTKQAAPKIPEVPKPPKEFKKVKEIKPTPKKTKTPPKPIPENKPKTQTKTKPFNLNEFLNAKSKKEGKEEDEKLDDITKSYIKLYGEEFSKYSDETKKYLRESLSSIGQITQRYLEYPYLAAYGGQSGTNVIEFFLHPDGSISDVKIKTSSGYNILDWNTKDTIEKAYRDYPRPKEKTKIIIYVKYILK